MFSDQKPKQSNLKKAQLILAAVVLISSIVALWTAGYLGKKKEVVKPLSQNLTSFSCGASTVADIDNNIYKTVQIGEQCWLKENLKVTKNPEGKLIARYCYSGDPKICETDGGLYDWNTAMNGSVQEGAQGICPNGWHVPKDSDWYMLENYLKDEGESCSNNRYEGWDCYAVGAKLKMGGISGFDAILAGSDFSKSEQGKRGNEAYLWSSVGGDYAALYRFLYLDSAAISRSSANKSNAFSVRCLKD